MFFMAELETNKKATFSISALEDLILPSEVLQGYYNPVIFGLLH